MSDRRPLRHGTRWTYQHGCRCRRCRWAESTYRRQLRTLRAKGQQPGHAKVKASLTWRLLRQMVPEFQTKGALALRLGLKRPILPWHTDRVTAQTEQRVIALYQQVMQEDCEQPFTS